MNRQIPTPSPYNNKSPNCNVNRLPNAIIMQYIHGIMTMMYTMAKRKSGRSPPQFLSCRMSDD